ncbi:unnamed protein product [Rhodiola kirilowii]
MASNSSMKSFYKQKKSGGISKSKPSPSISTKKESFSEPRGCAWRRCDAAGCPHFSRLAGSQR